MYASLRRSHYWLQQSRKYGTTCCIVALFHNSVCCCFASCVSLRHMNLIHCGVLFFKGLQRYRVIRQLPVYGKYYVKNVAIQKWPVKMTGKTGVLPVESTIRPDIVRWPAVILSPAYTSFLWTVRVQKMGQRDVFVKYAVIKSSACYSALLCTREEKTLMTENTRGRRS